MNLWEPDKSLYYNYKFEKIWVQFRKTRRRISCNFNFRRSSKQFCCQFVFGKVIIKVSVVMRFCIYGLSRHHGEPPPPSSSISELTLNF